MKLPIVSLETKLLLERRKKRKEEGRTERQEGGMEGERKGGRERGGEGSDGGCKLIWSWSCGKLFLFLYVLCTLV